MSRSSNTARAGHGVDAAVSAFASGGPVLIHDATDREGEVDLVYPAAAVAPTDVSRMRNDAGGLVCVALPDSVCAAWGLPFSQGLLDHPAGADHELDYDERSSFSITVNHRGTFTGITDDDRALTISELGAAAGRIAHERRVAGDGAAGAIATDAESFAESFRAPGHVHLLRGAPDLLADREGHTELGLALADAAGVEPAVVVCEMLDDGSGGALSPAAARSYADRNGFPYVEGSELIARFG
ncbi:3,4-dihydroxy-2-butanone-4-phosphate synthase [Natronomonas sp. LN261]|jgi:3,4-dihydroxy 2-butanone 4-phosphate synthase|uniref:3,4-dihydroxy-2-butanone-4-phosphate synthase n=1 Tax=Natronomonas sp. LN261 TaxID=2750669 RepID=UPI0015EEEDC0|nr:3,4-dihydroxy-2-butanone-4-phosphate synthase [Natronomonas sp. LN261]